MKKFSIGIIGMGYVGLPLAVAFSKKYLTLGYDINNKRLDELRGGIDRTNELESQSLKKNLKNLSLTNDIQNLKNCNIYIITVPTPVNEDKTPNLNPITEATLIVSGILKKDDIIIFESTVYPGLTEEICVPILENGSKLNFNKEFFVGYSPERINPGDKNHTIKKIIKVVSGSNNQTLKIISKLYNSIIEAGVYEAPSIKIAEAAKVIENSQRDINIAFVNELSIIFNKMGISTGEVLKAANTKWNFLNFYPGLVGGHCIGVDPYYLTYKSEKVGYYPEVILAGRRINDGMATWYVEELIKEMYMKDFKIDSVEALVLGFTFKENCPDTRNTKVFDLINALNKNKIKCDVVDPFANKDDTFAEYGIRIKNDISTNKRYSLVILAVSHENFRKFDNLKWKSFCEDKSIILDLKGIVPKELNPIRP